MTINKKNKSKEKPACSPLSDSDNTFSCLSSNQLRDMAKKWNKKHPDRVIKGTKPREIWNEFKEIFKGSCNNEKCWLKNGFLRGGMSDDMIASLYAPDAPKKWRDNPRTWLSSSDITSVMKQYEEKYPCFNFIGPSPIDFDTLLYNEGDGTPVYVWDELRKFNVNKQGVHTKIGVIFNTDPHYKSGEHWVSLFVDLKRDLVVYFDSAGDDIPKEIMTLVERIQKQGKESNPIRDFKFIKNHPVQHQKKNTECGMYSLYFIIQMLKTKSDYAPFLDKKNKINDEEMEALRKEYFNIP